MPSLHGKASWVAVEMCPICMSDDSPPRKWPGGCGHVLCETCCREILRRGILGQAGRREGKIFDGSSHAPCPICRRPAGGWSVPAPDRSNVRVLDVFQIFVSAIGELVGPPSHELFSRIWSLVGPLTASEAAAEWCQKAIAVANESSAEARAQLEAAPGWLLNMLSQVQTHPEYCRASLHRQISLLSFGFAHKESRSFSTKVQETFRRPDVAAMATLQLRLEKKLHGFHRFGLAVADRVNGFPITEALEELRPFVGLSGSESLVGMHIHCQWDQRASNVLAELLSGWDL